jgi:hypothetical protein
MRGRLPMRTIIKMLAAATLLLAVWTILIGSRPALAEPLGLVMFLDRISASSGSVAPG